jgi:hypothetical protein
MDKIRRKWRKKKVKKKEIRRNTRHAYTVEKIERRYREDKS